MNTTADRNDLAVMQPQDFPDERSSASALMMSPATMESLMRVADLMASGKSTVPVHLQKNPADCMAVVMQSMQWGMNPFAVAQKTHVVNGTLGYEAQLVNAVVQQSRAIQGRFCYEYQGASPNLECRVGAQIRGEANITWGNWLNEAKVTVKNSPLWKTNPMQQLGYLQVKNWARQYCPGAILGIYTADELRGEQKDMGPVVLAGTNPALDAALDAARGGRVSFEAWWKTCKKEDRARLSAADIETLKKQTLDADAKRTVDTAPVFNEGEASFESVMQRLYAAKNEDELYIAGDWIGGVDDGEQRAVLIAKFNELLEKFMVEKSK
jgi:hypothetical protein